jgi:hypothetical protein
MLLAFGANLALHRTDHLAEIALVRPLETPKRRHRRGIPISINQLGVSWEAPGARSEALRDLGGETPLVHSSIKGAIVIPSKQVVANVRQPIIATEPLVPAADVLRIAVAENKSLREALAKIYGEAMMSTEPPAATWYRIAEIAEVALAREWPAAGS